MERKSDWRQIKGAKLGTGQ